MTGRYAYLDDGSKIFLDELSLEKGTVTGRISATVPNPSNRPRDPNIVSIPVSEGEKLSKRYDFDQVIIIARKVGENGGESVTTYGKDKVNCDIAARIGNFLKYKIMMWDFNEERGHND